MFGLSKKRIYLDTAATTPVDRRVLAAMRPYFSDEFGNPSSLHREGVRANEALAAARAKVASVLGAHADEIIFTGSGTEGDNLALIGVARGLLAARKIERPGHIIVSAIEHRAVLEAAKFLVSEGWQISYLPVDKNGVVSLTELERALRPETVLVSVMYANNEIGTIEPIREIAKILRHWRKVTGDARRPYFHTDACQAARFLPLSVEKLGVDLLTLNGSKIYGPKGIGCLYVRRNTFLAPVIVGGGQERGLRSGTENVALAAGLARALEISSANGEAEGRQLEMLRDRLEEGLLALPGTSLNGGKKRLPHLSSISFDSIFGELLVLSLDAKGVAVSTGSACSAHHKDDAHVIMSLGKTRTEAENTVRFSLDRRTTAADIDYVLRAVKKIIEQNKNIKI